MVGTNGDAIDQLDQLWDETIRGTPHRPPDLDPGLAGTVRRLHALGDAVAPDSAFARRLWADLSQPVAAMNVGATRSAPLVPHASLVPFAPVIPSAVEESARPDAQRRIPRHARNDGIGAQNDGEGAWNDRVGGRFFRLGWQRGLAGVLMAAVLTLALVAGYATVRLQAPASNARLPAVSDSGASALYAYVFNGTGESATDRWEVILLDPMTLTDRPTEGADAVDLPAWAGVLSEDWTTHLWALSADGSTFVVLESRQFVNGEVVKEATFGIYDGRTGAERGRFSLSVYVRDIRLSRDGARLVIQGLPLSTQLGTAGTSDPSDWYVVDTADGQVVATAEPDERDGWHADSWIDPTASRLYRVFVPYSPRNTGPGATRIVANDLTTGTEIGRLELPEVRSGVWNTGRTRTVTGGVEYPIMAELRPGVALSPDGKTLALVHADADAVTLIDAERFAVEQTEPLAQPAGWQDTLLGFLPLIPDDAAAKGAAEGIALQAVFAADGRHLYIFGSETAMDDDGNAHGRSLGLRLVDLERAEIVADSEDLMDDFFDRVMPAPNGRDLYIFGSLPADDASHHAPPWRLWRLDTATLTVRAERDFTGTLRIHLSPAVPDGKGQLPPGAG